MREFARSWTGPLDVLVNDAGVMDVPAARTPEGFDVQTATNHLGPFVLTRLLLPVITDRVVSVTSQLHRLARLDLDDIDWRARRYRPMPAHRDSKLALVLFSLELQRRLAAEGSPIRSVLACSPCRATPTWDRTGSEASRATRRSAGPPGPASTGRSPRPCGGPRPS